MTAVMTTHIVVDDRGVAWIEGTGTKVKEVVLDKLCYGWSPEECTVSIRICRWLRLMPRSHIITSTRMKLMRTLNDASALLTS